MEFLISPVSEISTTPYETTITTTNYVTPLYPVTRVTAPLVTSLVAPVYYDYDTGMNDNYLAQKEMTKWFLYRVLDKWLYDAEMSHLLKYLKISGDSIKLISSKKEFDDNKISNDSVKDIEKKADWFEENMFGISEMKSLLKKVVEELGYKWYDLPRYEKVVVKAVGKILNKKLKEKTNLD